MNVEMTNISYIRLANCRLVIEGYCIKCSSKLLKTKVMPISGLKKKKLMAVNKRRGKEKKI
jgi:predicted nucleic-acid-binding Zn-ribbon protein